MQMTFLFFALFAVAAQAEQENPMGKVIQLIDELAAKVTADGAAEEKAYKEYVEWCDDVSANTRNDITTLTSQKAKLEANIGDLAAQIEAGTSKIGELGDAIGQATTELSDASTIRKKENKEFLANEAELVDAIDTLDRAVNILQREMAKNPAALAQIDQTNMASILKSLSAVVDAAAINSVDKKTLLGLVQSQQGADSDDSDAGAPAAAVYQTHSTSIFDLLEDIKEKAEGELSALRKA